MLTWRANAAAVRSTARAACRGCPPQASNQVRAAGGQPRARLHGTEAAHKVDVQDAVHAEVERAAADVALRAVGAPRVLGVEDLQGGGRGGGCAREWRGGLGGGKAEQQGSEAAGRRSRRAAGQRRSRPASAGCRLGRPCRARSHTPRTPAAHSQPRQPRQRRAPRACSCRLLGGLRTPPRHPRCSRLHSSPQLQPASGAPPAPDPAGCWAACAPRQRW